MRGEVTDAVQGEDAGQPPDPWPVWARWTAPVGVTVAAAHVMGARLLDGVAAVAANITAAAALGAVGLVLWQQRTTAQTQAEHVDQLARLIHQLQEQVQEVHWRWHEYHHKRMQELAEEESAWRLNRIDEQVQAILQRVDLLAGSQEPSGADREVLVAIGRRLHALISRAVEAVTEVERQVEDPDLLHEIFRTDHLLILLRRAAARLAVLGGETARTVNWPVPLATVLRQAAAEVEQYRRVTVGLPATDVALPGHAGPDVIHLLAELVENATKFSPPTTQVVMRTVPNPAETATEVDRPGEVGG